MKLNSLNKNRYIGKPWQNFSVTYLNVHSELLADWGGERFLTIICHST